MAESTHAYLLRTISEMLQEMPLPEAFHEQDQQRLIREIRALGGFVRSLVEKLDASAFQARKPA